VWGGHTVEGQFQTYLNGGAVLDARDLSWTELGNEGAPAARTRHVSVFADVVLFVWGGRDGMSALATGGLYDPDTRAWRATPDAAAPPAASDASAVWTGEAASARVTRTRARGRSSTRARALGDPCRRMVRRRRAPGTRRSGRASA
jgi:hypothetical protein